MVLDWHVGPDRSTRTTSSGLNCMKDITAKECARIQSFDVDGVYGTPFQLGANDGQAYKQLGNAVNVNMIYMIQERVDEFLSGSPDFPPKSPIQKKLF